MEIAGTVPTSSEDLGTEAHLARLSGVQDVRSFGDGISVVFPEADFVISLSTPPSASVESRCDTHWEVTVREPLPGLNTWWGRWQRSFAVHRRDVGPLVAEELQEAISRVRGMLDDHARTTGEVQVSEA